MTKFKWIYEIGNPSSNCMSKAMRCYLTLVKSL